MSFVLFALPFTCGARFTAEVRLWLLSASLDNRVGNFVCYKKGKRLLLLKDMDHGIGKLYTEFCFVFSVVFGNNGGFGPALKNKNLR